MAQLHLDLDVLEDNIRLVAARISQLGKHWRPHINSHRQPGIAHMLMEAGAIGVTAATVPEAETMTAAEVPSILLAHLVVNDGDIDRLARCARQTELILCIDHYVHAERLSLGARRNGVTFKVLIDVDVGMHRTGCRPRIDAAQLGFAAAQLPGLHLAGVMGYEGHTNRIADMAQRCREVDAAMNTLAQTHEEMLRHGLTCEIVSAGSSCSFPIAGQHPVVTELQVGGAIFGESVDISQSELDELGRPLIVTAEIVSRPSLTQAVVNCGRIALSTDSHPPIVATVDGAVVDAMTAEHTVLQLTGDSRDLRIGDTIRFVVGSADRTVHLHDTIHVHRGTQTIDKWPVLR